MGARWRLTQKQIDNARRPGKYADGGGLYLQVRESVSGGLTKSWIYRYRIAGVTLTKEGKITSREMGLGSLDTIGLAEARESARKARVQVDEGTDPATARDEAKAEKVAATAKILTFRACAEAYMKGPARTKWTNPKHIGQWVQTLEDYAYPKIGNMAVDRLDTEHVLRVLEQPVNIGTAKRPQLESLWIARPETASRLRGRIEKILAWAKQRKYRAGENPASWDNLKDALPGVSRLARIKHHPALPFAEAPAFVKTLREQEGVAARALEFLILSAARTGEVIGATWAEIDIAGKVWTIPGERMKGKKPHRVPLVDRAIAILEEMEELRDGDYVFPGRGRGAPMSNMAMLKLLERMGRADITVHGFRSVFRDWGSNRTPAFSSELLERALSHVRRDKTEAAYARSDLLEPRRPLMLAWVQYLEKPAATVHPIEEKRARRVAEVAL